MPILHDKYFCGSYIDIEYTCKSTVYSQDFTIIALPKSFKIIHESN